MDRDREVYRHREQPQQPQQTGVSIADELIKLANLKEKAAGSNVYVSWWERNVTNNEPVLRVSNDNGKTFGEKIMLSAK